MNAELRDTREIEVELILRTWDGAFPDGCPRLDSNYFLEDRRAQGRGLIISEDMPATGDLDKAIVDFLSPLKNNAEALRVYSPLVRVAVYNRAFSCCLYIKSLPLLVQFGAELEIDVYPTSDDDEGHGVSDEHTRTEQ
jgi:hypothetical protein